MKKFTTYIIIAIFCVCIVTFFVNYIIQKSMLTKNLLFDIISKVENIVIADISKDGNRTFTNENKIDFLIKYIIDNREKYKNNITLDNEDYYEYNNTPYYNFGRVDEKFIQNLSCLYFERIPIKYIKDSKFYTNGEVLLNYEPIEPFYYDEKNVLETKEDSKSYKVYIQYKRELNDIQNDIYVVYTFNKELKIKNVTIYNSILK